MLPERLPFAKAFDTPFMSLDQTNVEMASILFLFVTVMLVAHVHRHRQWLRRLVQLASFAVFFGVIYSCLGVFGMIRNGLYGVTLLGTVYSEAFYWLALPVAVSCMTLVSGPVFCSFVCPTGTIQEYAALLRRKLLPFSPTATRPRKALLGLFLAVFVSLVAIIGSDQEMFIEDSSLHWAAALLLLCYLVLLGVLDDQPTRALRIVSVLAIITTAVSHVSITSPVHFAFTSRNDPASAVSTLVIALAAMVTSRAWCRYLCPWGFWMGFLSRFSRVRVEKQAALCHGCDSCASQCEVEAIHASGIRHDQCQLCYACVDHCPNGAIRPVDAWQPTRDTGARALVDLGGRPRQRDK